MVTVLAAEALVVGQGPDAMKLLADVRAALGGEEKLAAVKSVAVEGRMTRSSGAQSQVNDFEMAIELPDKFVKKEVIAVIGSSALTRTTGFNGDGLIELIDTPPSMGGGMVVTRMAGSGAPAGMKATPEQVERQRQALLASNKREFARLSLGLFAKNPEAFPLEFTYAGEAEAPDGKAHVIDVKGADGFSARLFVDTKTRLPLMLSWMDKEPLRMTSTGGAGAAAGSGTVMTAHGAAFGGQRLTPEQADEMRQEMEQRMKEAEANRRTVEYRIFYGDYRAFAGVRMPTRIQRMIDGKAVEELSLEKVKVNSRIDPGKFEVTR
jgi:hypothetical protein